MIPALLARMKNDGRLALLTVALSSAACGSIAANVIDLFEGGAAWWFLMPVVFFSAMMWLYASVWGDGRVFSFRHKDDLRLFAGIILAAAIASSGLVTLAGLFGGWGLAALTLLALAILWLVSSKAWVFIGDAQITRLTITPCAARPDAVIVMLSKFDDRANARVSAEKFKDHFKDDWPKALHRRLSSGLSPENAIGEALGDMMRVGRDPWNFLHNTRKYVEYGPCNWMFLLHTINAMQAERKEPPHIVMVPSIESHGERAAFEEVFEAIYGAAAASDRLVIANPVDFAKMAAEGNVIRQLEPALEKARERADGGTIGIDITFGTSLISAHLAPHVYSSEDLFMYYAHNNGSEFRLDAYEVEADAAGTTTAPAA